MAVQQMLTASAQREDSTASTTFTDLVPTPAIQFTTGANATITAMFVAECRVSAATKRLDVRILVDGAATNPANAAMTQTSKYETHSHVAFKNAVPPGTHTVKVQWRVSGGTGFVRNRTFTVFEVR
jgi:hypothetical protein